jgi:hypothetical protein
MNRIGGPHYGALAMTIASILNDVSCRGRPPPVPARKSISPVVTARPICDQNESASMIQRLG